jgi:hypothetical protein
MANTDTKLQCIEAMKCVNQNINSVTEIYATSTESAEAYADAIRPLLVQQIKILELLQENE